MNLNQIEVDAKEQVAEEKETAVRNCLVRSLQDVERAKDQLKMAKDSYARLVEEFAAGNFDRLFLDEIRRGPR